MKKLLLTLLLVVVSSSAIAEWVKTGDTNTGTAVDFTHYSDIATIRASGNKAKMWVLRDFNTVQEIVGVRFLSTKYQYEFDCKEERTRYPYIIWYSKNMGEGAIPFRDDNPKAKWSPIVPGSVDASLLEVACGK